MKIERFLLLDDNTTNTLFFEMLLKELGYTEVFTSPTGDDALIVAEKNHIQFVICAWELQGMPGTVFIQKLRAKKRRRYLPCVIYSKRMESDDVGLTQDLGFKHILAMPFDRNQAKAMIQEIVDHENNLSPKENQLRKIEMYVANGQPMEAYKLFTDQMFEKGPYLVRALVVAAEVFIGISKYDKAQKCLDDALRSSPENSKALQIQARLYSRQGKHEEAIKLLEGLVDRSPKNLTNRIKLGSAYVDADRLEDAKRMFNGVLDRDPGSQDCKDGLAMVAFKEGDLGLAEQLIAETENGNELARVFNNMAISQVAKGEFDYGIVTYQNAMKLLADKARLHLLHYNLGLALRKKGDLTESLVALARSYTADPSFEKAYVAIARIVDEMKKNGLSPDKTVVSRVKKARSAFKAGKIQKSA